MREKYNNYFRWGVTVISIIAFGILFFFFVFRMDSILGFLGKIFDILTPIILGAVIAIVLIISALILKAPSNNVAAYTFNYRYVIYKTWNYRICGNPCSCSGHCAYYMQPSGAVG